MIKNVKDGDGLSAEFMNEIINTVNNQEKMIQILTQILIKNDLTTDDEINDIIISIDVMEKIIE